MHHPSIIMNMFIRKNIDFDVVKTNGQQMDSCNLQNLYRIRLLIL